MLDHEQQAMSGPGPAWRTVSRKFALQLLSGSNIHNPNTSNEPTPLRGSRFHCASKLKMLHPPSARNDLLPPLIDVSLSTWTGVHRGVSTNQGIEQWLDVRYARAPVGELAVTEVNASATTDASSCGNACPQPPTVYSPWCFAVLLDGWGSAYGAVSVLIIRNPCLPAMVPPPARGVVIQVWVDAEGFGRIWRKGIKGASRTVSYPMPQTNEDGKRLGVAPRMMVVPSSSNQIPCFEYVQFDNVWCLECVVGVRRG
ncbi:hypothetical protein DXG01_009421 [Tephrocybe rancida]|nr:hypothetical protein DXG01_009421 [Tephrocybe rancida]